MLKIEFLSICAVSCIIRNFQQITKFFVKSKFPPKRFTTLAAVKEKNVSAIKERVDRTQQKIQGSKYKGH